MRCRWGCLAILAFYVFGMRVLMSLLFIYCYQIDLSKQHVKDLVNVEFRSMVGLCYMSLLCTVCSLCHQFITHAQWYYISIFSISVPRWLLAHLILPDPAMSRQCFQFVSKCPLNPHHSVFRELWKPLYYWLLFLSQKARADIRLYH